MKLKKLITVIIITGLCLIIVWWIISSVIKCLCCDEGPTFMQRLLGYSQCSGFYELFLRVIPIVFVLIYLVIVKVLVKKYGAQIHIYEDLLHVCAWCNKIKGDDRKWHGPEYWERKIKHITHTICPICAKKHK